MPFIFSLWLLFGAPTHCWVMTVPNNLWYSESFAFEFHRSHLSEYDSQCHLGLVFSSFYPRALECNKIVLIFSLTLQGGEFMMWLIHNNINKKLMSKGHSHEPSPWTFSSSLARLRNFYEANIFLFLVLSALRLSWFSHINDSANHINSVAPQFLLRRFTYWRWEIKLLKRRNKMVE